MSDRPFVTGGGGFSGRHLSDVLHSRGQDPAAPERGELELLDAEAVRAVVREMRSSEIMHEVNMGGPSQHLVGEPRDHAERPGGGAV